VSAAIASGFLGVAKPGLAPNFFKSFLILDIIILIFKLLKSAAETALL
jgi:hypothetical protein